MFFFNAIRISKVLGHYINCKIQYSTARTAVRHDCNYETRTKTSIRYAKENDGEKRERRRERKKGRRRDIEREGEIRERESERESKILVKSPKPRNKA